MFSWMSKEEGRKGVNAVYDNVTAGLQNIYKNKLLPLEKEYNFHDFHSPKLEVRIFWHFYIYTLSYLYKTVYLRSMYFYITDNVKDERHFLFKEYLI